MALALVAGMASATAAYADTLSWSVSGTDVTGGGTMTATLVSGDEYLITAMTGSMTINGVGGAVDFIPYGGAAGTYGVDSSGLYDYDDLVYLSSVPQLDEYGLLFDVAGFSAPLNLCGGPGCSTGGSQYIQWDAAGDGPSNDLGYAGYYDAYPVTFSATLVPEASVLGLTGLGLLALMFGFGWAKRAEFHRPA